MFVFQKKIDFYDCDPAGIMFYGRVFELCHSAYESLIESFQLQEDYWNNENYIVPIIHSEAFYHKPLTHKDIVTVNIKVTQLKSSSFELYYETFNNKDDRCHKIKTAHVFLDKSNWKKIPIPENIYNKLLFHKEET